MDIGGQHAAQGSISSASSNAALSALPNSTKATGSSSKASGSQRKERGAIAAQVRLLPSPHREKDKTLGEILERLKSLENKIDVLGLRSTLGPTLFTAAIDASNTTPDLPRAGSSVLISEPPVAHIDAASWRVQAHTHYRHSPAVYQMLGWPVVQQLLEPLKQRLPELASLAVEHEALNVVLHQHHPESRLPHDTFVSMPTAATMAETTTTATTAAAATTPTARAPSSAMQTTAGSASATAGFTSPRAAEFHPSAAMHIDAASSVSWDTIYRLSSAYFDTFNLIYPIVDRQSFLTTTLASVFDGAWDNSASTTVAFLVLGLGEVAMAGAQGAPFHIYNGRPSGIRGGTTDHPPGLAFFNEARQRMGFVLSDCSLENVQVYALAGYFNNELGLPLTGLDKYEDVVGLPDFINSDRTSPLLHKAGDRETTATMQDVPNDNALPPSVPAAVAQMALQLEGWRGMLPPQLQWEETKSAEFPSVLPGTAYTQPGFPSAGLPLGAAQPPPPGAYMFSTDLDAPPVKYAFAFDIQVALLRSRYYYSKYLIYRPFVYKALHHPEHMSHDDALGAAECLKACLKWPITMSPTCTHKRLVPCLFFCTQNVLGILVLLRLAQQAPILLRIKATLCGDSFELEARETIGLCMDWLRDLQTVDRAARWAWDIAKGIYHLEG
ncbi:hypothetical protein SPI_02991 [Niveomyces insectorum RCEF 264]|uniref:Transcription factor domain-containing protein n=1 Tax=Niveomyces insectorum RCEF 264 TaxID=1081102 RepID=A0A167WZ76_9HYPO|nr:hypothetical protein SPI_02991 [Niveomyces insectorum RCEF 264]